MPRYFVSLDVGTKTIGVARSPAGGPAIVTPQLVLRRQGLKTDIPRLLATVQPWGTVETFIVGLPLDLDGNEGRSARLALSLSAVTTVTA